MLNISFIGRLVQDPELRYTGEGTAVCNLNVAVNRRWTGSDGERKEETTWVRVTCWRGLAESVAKYMSKGRQVFVRADRFNNDPETGGPKVFLKGDGTYGAQYEVTAADVEFLGSGSGAPIADSTPGDDEADEIF
jgi:single-strand DNA-binding protein